MRQEDNPFSPSEAQGLGGGGEPEGVDLLEPVPLDIGPIFSRSWKVFTDHPGVLIAAVVAIVVPNVVLGTINTLINNLLEATSEEVQLVLLLMGVGNIVLQQLVTLFFSLGAVRILLHVTRGQEAEAEMVMGEGASFLPALVVQILLTFGLVVSSLPAVLLAVAAGLGTLRPEIALFIDLGYMGVAVILWIIVFVGLQFVNFLIVDRHLGPVEAIRASWRLTRGYKATIVGIDFLLGLLFIPLICFTCGLGAYLVVPIGLLVHAVMYHSLTHYQSLADDAW